MENRVAARTPFRSGTLVAVLVKVSETGPLIDFPENPEAEPLLARTTVALDAGDEGREVAVTFEFDDPLRPLIIGLIRSQSDPPKSAVGASPMLFIGVVKGQERDSRVTVQAPTGLITCSLINTGGGTLRLLKDEAVLVADLPGRPPCILGVLSDSPSRTRSFESDRLVLDAAEELVLKTKKSCLVLRSNGDIEIRGERIASRARNLQKMVAPTIKLN